MVAKASIDGRIFEVMDKGSIVPLFDSINLPSSLDAFSLYFIASFGILGTPPIYLPKTYFVF